MSSTNDQSPLTRRQVRDLERAREAGDAITGSISLVSGSPVPSNMPVTTPSPASHPATRRPGSHLAPPASVAAPAPSSAPFGDAGGPTRRELRAQRDASAPAVQAPVPLKAPRAETDRNLSDALSHVADIQKGAGSHQAVPAPGATATPAPRPESRNASPASPSSPPSADAPQPRSVRRSDDTPTSLPSRASHAQDSTGTVTDDAPIRRRSSGATGSIPVVANTTPAPTSTPGVFPFAVSGAAPGSAGDPSEASAPTTVADASLAAAEAAPVADAASADAAVTPVAVPATSAPAPVAEPDVAPVGPSPVAEAPVTAAPATEAPDAAAPTAAATVIPAPAAPRPNVAIPASLPEPSAYVPPTGHWSTQADVDDDDDTIESVGSRFGAHTGQQNALILDDDSLPDVTGALNATGEVIITGSIDLPRSLATTGSHSVQRIDGADIDRMLEEGDREAPSNDATPVRASRAVSANTSTRAVVLAAGKPASNRLPIILGACVVGLIVVIVGLVVVGFATGILTR